MEKVMKWILRLTLVFMMLFMGHAAFFPAKSEVSSLASVTPQEALAYIEQTPDVFILDVRTPAEFAQKHVPDAVNIPVEELEGRIDEVPADRPVVVYCRSGVRAGKAGAMLNQAKPEMKIFVVKGFILQ